MLLKAIDWFVYDVCRLSAENRWAGAFHFFLYDTVKILFLLFVMMAAAGFLRSFLPREKMKSWLGNRGLAGYVAAALFGALTPFCSCSSIPIFLGFLGASVPLGVTFSFLITSPIINEYLVVLMLGFFGWKITMIYVLSGVLAGVLGGWVMGTMNPERYLEDDIFHQASPMFVLPEFSGILSRLTFGVREAVSVIEKIWVWVLAGVGIGAVIHNYVPAGMVQSLVSGAGIFSVPLAVLLGIPMYGSCAAIVPIAVVLFQKGVPLGTAMSFMMAVSALSLPAAIMLRRALKLKMIAVFFAVVTVYMIVMGYALNILQPLFVQAG